MTYFAGYYIYDQGAVVQDDTLEDEEDVGCVYDSQEVDAMLERSTNVSSQKTKWRRVHLKSLNDDGPEDLYVKGLFIFLMPWWELAVYLERPTGGDRYRKMTRPPEYSIRSDTKLDQHGAHGPVMYQFLNECGVEDPEIKTNFLQYLRSLAHERQTTVNFSLLCDVIKNLSLIEDEAKQSLVCLVKKYLAKSALYRTLLIAMECPTIPKLLPILLPKHLQSLMEKVDFEKCVKLERILKEEPWLLAFRYPIKEETGLVLPEVDVEEFKKAGLFDKIPIKYIQNALLVYSILKGLCERYRNTFSWFTGEKSLKRQYFKKYPYRTTDWISVWPFLEEQKAIYYEENAIRNYAVEEENEKKKSEYQPRKVDRIFLYKYWWAENSIAKNLRELINQAPNEDDDEKMDVDDALGQDEDGGGSHGDEDARKTSDEGSKKSNDSNTVNHLALKCLENGDGDDADFVDPLQMQSAVKLVPQKQGCSTDVVDKADTDRAIVSRNQKKDWLDPQQQAAAKCIHQKPFSLIMGRGGCGKTHVACTVLQEYKNTEIVMAAPTGKAASNLAKQCRNYPNMVAKTLTQIHYQYALAVSKGQVDRWEFKNTQILVVDECSMVSVIELSRVLKAMMKDGNLKKLILMGDYRQLPSVDSGNLLEDLYRYFKDSDMYVELTKNWRTSPGSRLIVDNAKAISLQQMPKCPPNSKSFQMIAPPKNDDLEEGKDKYSRRKKLITKLCKNDASIKDHKRSQIVTYTRKAVRALNETCCLIYANHDITVNKKFLFKVGDKICPTRNANITDMKMKREWERMNKKEKEEKEKRMKEKEEKRQKEEEKQRRKAEKRQKKDQKKKKKKEKKSKKKKKKKHKCDDDMAADAFDGLVVEDADEQEDEDKAPPPYIKRICNGEIFYITKISKDEEEVTITDLDRTFTVPMKELQDFCHILHAWARTIHTYQGSETETVIYWLNGTGGQSWKHVYTAVTRGKNSVYIVGTKEDLQVVINTPHKYRFTALWDMLKTQMGSNRQVQPGPVDRTRQVERSSLNKLPQCVAKPVSNITSHAKDVRSNIPQCVAKPVSKKSKGITSHAKDVHSNVPQCVVKPVSKKRKGITSHAKDVHSNVISSTNLTPIKYSVGFQRYVPDKHPSQSENAHQMTGLRVKANQNDVLGNTSNSRPLVQGASNGKALSSDSAKDSKVQLSDKPSNTKALSSDKALSLDRASTSKTLLSDKASNSKALSSEKASNSKALLSDKASNSKALSSEKASNSKALLSDKASNSKALSSDNASNSKALLSDKASNSKALLSDNASNSKALLSDKASNSKALLSDKASNSKALLSDNASNSKALLSDKAFNSKALLSDKASNSKALSSYKSSNSKSLSSDRASKSEALKSESRPESKALTFRGIEPVLKRPVQIERAQNLTVCQSRTVNPVLLKSVETALDTKLCKGKHNQLPSEPTRSSVDVFSTQTTINGVSSNATQTTCNGVSSNATNLTISQELDKVVAKQEKRNKLSRHNNKKLNSLKRALLGNEPQQPPIEENHSTNMTPCKKPKIVSMTSPLSTPNVDKPTASALSECPMRKRSQEDQDCQSLHSPLKTIQLSTSKVSTPSPCKQTESSVSAQKKWTFSTKKLPNYIKRENPNIEDGGPSKKKALFN